MSEDTVRCTSCGRSFAPRAMGPKARCLYCGGKLAGPGLEHLELVDPDGTEPADDDTPSRFEVLEGSGPSRWQRPVLWLHELAVLSMLVMITGLAVALLVRHDPMLPPSALRTAMLAALPVLFAGGICLKVGLELFTGPSRSVVVGLVLLGPGLLLGLPSALARTLARLHGGIFGVWGLALVLIATLAGMSWLADRHDPLIGAQTWLEAQPMGDRVDPDWEPVTTGWSGRLSGEGDGGFSLRFDSVADGTWAGTLTWVQSGRVDAIRGAYVGNHLAFTYPGPPWIERWWFRPGMRSLVDLLVVGDGQLEGKDLVFGHSLAGQRVWQRQAPTVSDASVADAPRLETEQPPSPSGPVVLRPMIPVDDTRITTGRAFVLRPPQGEATIVTAASLFGPAGGLDAQLNPQMLPALVGDASFFDLREGAQRAHGSMRRPPSGARPMQRGSVGPPDASRDLVTLSLMPGYSIEPLELRDEPVQSGQTLWLPDLPDDRAPGEEAMLAGLVGTSWEHGYALRFSGTASLEGRIGAPLLDADGRVAGMLVGFDDDREGARGIVMPAAWIAALLTD